MELHHLHVAQRKAGAQCHGEAIAALVARGRVIAVHRRPAASGEQHGLGAHEHVVAGAHVDEQHAGDCRAVGGLDQLDGAVLFQAVDAPRPDLLGEAVHDLDAGQIALVHRAVERLAGEGFLVHRAVGIAVEEAAQLVLQFPYSFNSQGDELPGELLVGQPLAALDGVHEVALDRVFLGERDVVAALDHARAAAFAEQAFHRHGDRELGRRLVRMQRGEQPRAAGAEDQDVCVEGLRNHCIPSTTSTSTKPITSAAEVG